MAPGNPAEESATAESYPTFWEAIPVADPAGSPEPRPLVASTPPGDAYAAFLALTEDGPASSLTVEQTDVG